MPIRWIPVTDDRPAEGDVVMVANRNEVWTTQWRDALADHPGLAAPVLKWSPDAVIAPKRTYEKVLVMQMAADGYMRKRMKVKR